MAQVDLIFRSISTENGNKAVNIINRKLKKSNEPVEELKEERINNSCLVVAHGRKTGDIYTCDSDLRRRARNRSRKI